MTSRKATRGQGATNPDAAEQQAAAEPASPVGPQDAPPARDWRHLDRLQLAELLNVHPDTVTDYTRAGMPVIDRGGRGKTSIYDAVACLAWRDQTQGKNSKEVARSRAYDASAALNEMKLARERGELVSREAVVAAGQSYSKAWSTMVRGLPRRLTQAGLVPREQEPAVAEVCRGVLLEITRWRTVADTDVAARQGAA